MPCETGVKIGQEKLGIFALSPVFSPVFAGFAARVLGILTLTPVQGKFLSVTDPGTCTGRAGNVACPHRLKCIPENST